VIAAVSFDATGTLFRARDLAGDYARILERHGIVLERTGLRESIVETWREFGCTVDPSRDRFASHPRGARGFWRDVLDRVCALAGAPRPSAFAAAELFDHFGRADAWELYDDVLPALDALAAAGLPVAVASNWDERLPGVLAALGLGGRFAGVVYSAAVGFEKPHPGLFAAVSRRLGLAPGSILHVGDRRLEDLEGAQGAGFAALLLARAADEDGDIGSLAEVTGRLAAFA
jgi:putative hydrolase of the HAD superfamily